MKKTQVVFSVIVTTLLTMSGSWLTDAKAQSNNSLEKIQFACGQSYDRTSGQYIFTTFVWNTQRKKEIIIWKKEDFSNSGFDPQKRCELVSPRFQKAYANQSLKFLTHGTMNGQPVICTAHLIGGDCDTLLLTLRHQDDPLQALEQLTDILLGYADAPLEQSSDDKIYEEEGRIYIEIDIEDFLNQE